MKKTLSKEHIKTQFLILLLSVASFLLFAIFIGNLKWLTDFRSFILLLSGIFAIFTGIISLLRYSTQKESLQYFLLGVGFLGVGVLDIVSLLMSIGNFNDLFTTTGSIYSLRTILSKAFLSLLLFASFFFGTYAGKNGGKKSKVFGIFIVFLFFAFLIVYLVFGQHFNEEYMTIILSVIGFIFLLISLIGYILRKNWKYENIDFWIIFSISFFLLSQIFYIPFLNLEVEHMINLSVLAQFFGYIALLLGFLNSIRELYLKEIENQKELEFTKRKVEEAYMTLREEKWNLLGEKKEEGKV
ncbi:MAG: hypothetical protein ACOX6Q_03995 [Candidatus Dojkabacteria bacterium]|jgi:hypothetical protein